jgi:ribonuclease BN (tRNA processing enzyme)
VKLTVIGCSGSFPGPQSAASCYLIEVEGHRIVVDLGNGALGALARHVDIYSVDAVLLSHLHADHCMDLLSFYVARKYHPDGPVAKIPVYGPTGTADRMARAYDLPLDPGMHGEFDFREFVPGGVCEIGPLKVRAERVAHPVEAYGMRFEHDGKVLAYSGDSGPTSALVDLARDAGIFLCEASFQIGRDHVADLHLNGRQAAENAVKAGAQGLIVTHVPPWNDSSRTLAEAQEVFADAELAAAGAVYEL